MAEMRIEQFRKTYKKCVTCGKEIKSGNRNRKSCSKQCRPSSQRLMPTSGMQSVKCGAHSELIACAYLLRQGYDVYRAVNWMSKADLVAVRGDEILRVQVRTCAYLNEKGTLGYKRPTDDAHDLLMVIDPDGNIIDVEFKSGVYRYHGCDQALFDDLMKAESVGKFVHANLKSKKFTRL